MNTTDMLYTLKTFDEKIQFVKNNATSIFDNDIVSIINSFACVSTIEEAMEFAQVVKSHANEDIILCYPSSIRQKTFLTVVDYLNGAIFNFCTAVKLNKKLLKDAFVELGYKHAKEHSLEELYSVYIKHETDVYWIFDKYPDFREQLIDAFFEGIDTEPRSGDSGSFMKHSFNKRLEYLKNTTLRFNILHQPEKIIDCFSDATTPTQAMNVVKAMYNNFNNHIVVCREESFKKGQFMTIVDVIESVDRTWKEKPSNQLFIKALRKNGFRSAKDSDHKKMKDMYQACADYHNAYPKLRIIPFPDCSNIDPLYDILLECTSVSQFINELKTSNYNFCNMIRPSCYFLMEEMGIREVDFTFEHALEIAQIFKERLGLITISRIDSFYEGKPVTIMDELDMTIEQRRQDLRVELFHRAFEQLGFKRAKECDPTVLHQLQTYTSNYDYEEMERSHWWIREAVAKEFYKPERIQKWIETGNELEDYMK